MYKVFGKPACAFCEAAKRELTTRGISYEYVDISTDNDAREFVVTEMGFRTVPLIMNGDTLVGGFKELKASLI